MSTSDIQPLRFGFFSTSRIGIKVAKAIAQSPFASLYAVASRDLSKAEKYAQEQGFEKSFGSYDELLQCAEVQAVYVPVPTAMKEELVIKAAKAGKHVLCDKPFQSAESVKKMKQACEENGVFFMDNTMWVHNKRTHHLKNLFNTDDRFKKLVRVNSSFANYFMDDLHDIRMNTDLEKTGCLGDLGWYSIRNILWAFNYELPQKVVGYSKKFESDQENLRAIINFDGLLFFSGGRVATLNCSFEEAQRQTSEIVFPRHRIMIDDFVLTWDNEDIYFPRETYDKKGKFRIHAEHGRFETITCEESTQHVELFESFYKGAKNPTENKHWGDESEKTMIVLDALLESSEKDGTPIVIQQ
ncbi:oxidoreductase [Naegleria gruberi]|uniref:Oxidoreductase n=1 Tax=Naegleria gruberi TaxID=5762 RepID=D2V8Y4_NAEGR|nr:oxidoreductase [Naegleria gruberi]EFC46771.1 oxidoreductase [Naegleria gruberi]|eukprot:XP_002679515.1 oxidoreductase [Naegleria gruberi]